ncbi:YodL domain-containing protein [Neobacillus sp. PS3-34]|uniref:YodL domain-containing protein n=1 Tax=Neobacillus sp. PS3-34 TaxID=3070678 RepID=UPI0027DEB4B4|nr:YodL domain-containing protein [Neobacillus sp. PS3-34]WML47860.1 YodL domain-containing protein [Neobacillus sp. PS3-34]
MIKLLAKKTAAYYDVTIFQTPNFRQDKGYKVVYRTSIFGQGHEDCLEKTFKLFNVADLMPKDYRGRFLSTGDILLIDQGILGQYYYQLKPEGWKTINRIHIR